MSKQEMIDDKMCTGCSSWPCQCITLDEWEIELLEKRIAKLEAELMEQARIVGMGAERELKLRTEFERLRLALEKINYIALSAPNPEFGLVDCMETAREALK